MRSMVNRLEKNWQRLWVLVALLCCVVSASAWAADIQVRAELDPVQMTQGQPARFVVTVTGTRSAEPDMPDAEGFHFIYQGQSSQASWINGKVSSLIAYTFEVYADKAGDFTIAPVKVRVQGKTYSGEPVQCTVLPAQNSGRAGGGSSGANTAVVTPDGDEAKDIGFMQIMLETERMYSGQVVPFTLKAYFRAGKRVTLKSAPRLSGEDFLLQSLDEEPRLQKEQVNGDLYTSLTWQGTLVAVKEGIFPLILEMDAEVMVRTRPRRGSPFGSSLLEDPFFSGILGNYSRREVKLISQEKELTVLDLPAENRPKDFSGAIGTFSLAVAASPLDGKVGDPITVKMQLEGTGNFALVQAPILSEKEGWKIYPASGIVQDLGAGKGMKIFEQAIIPTEQGLTAVPPMRFSYFDPQAEEYLTLTSDSIPLYLENTEDQSVDQSTSQAKNKQVPAAQGDPQNQQDQQRTGQDASGKTTSMHPGQHLASLHPELGKLVPAIQPLYEKFWFQLLIALALLSLLLALVLYLKQRRLAKNPSILRRKKVQGRLAIHYEEMNKALVILDQEAFRQHCRATIQQRTGEVWGLAPEAVTLADLEQRLPADAPLRVVFTRLEQSGYAGEQLSQDELQEILQTTRNELDKLA